MPSSFNFEAAAPAKNEVYTMPELRGSSAAYAALAALAALIVIAFAAYAFRAPPAACGACGAAAPCLAPARCIGGVCVGAPRR